MYKLSKLIIITVITFLSLYGCRSFGPTDPRVTIIGDHFPNDYTITEVKTTPHYGGFMEVQVTGQNHTSSYQQLEYRIEWLDQNQMLIPSAMKGWTAFPAFKNSEFRFKVVAPTTNTTDFRIKIRKKEN